MAEMEECQCRMKKALAGQTVCPCVGVDGQRYLPPFSLDFRLTDETPVAELEAFGLSVVIIGNLEKACIYNVSGLREWLRSGLRVEQIDGRKRDKIEKALAAAERWGK